MNQYLNKTKTTESRFKRSFLFTPFSLLAIFVVTGCTVDGANAGENNNKNNGVITDTKDAKPELILEDASKALEIKEVSAQILKTESYVQPIEVSGKALAQRESMLSLGVPGRVQKIMVSRGDKVKKNQILLKLNQSGFVLGVQQAAAAVAGAQAREDLMKVENMRLNNLLADGAAPTAALDELQAQTKGADAQARIAQASLSQARKALHDSVLRAPYDGVIADVFIEKGEQAPAMPPTMLMKIVDAATLEVQVFIPEEASSSVRIGDTATVTIEAADSVTEGKIIFVSDSINPGGRTFEVRIAIDNKDAAIKAGAYARVTLAQSAQGDALFIPITAMQRDANGSPFVFVADESSARRREITLGTVQGSRVRVVSGLENGDALITTTGNLSDGATIHITKE